MARITQEEKKYVEKQQVRIAAKKEESERLENEWQKQAALEFKRRRRGNYLDFQIA